MDAAYKIGFYGGDGVGFASRLLQELFLRYDDPGRLQIFPHDHPFLNVLVVNSCQFSNKSLQKPKMSDIIVVDSDDQEALAAAMQLCGKIITCGFNTKAAVTISGVGDGSVAVCVQRALLALNATPIYPHEFTLRIKNPERHISYVITTVTAGLLCGIKGYNN